MIAEGRLHVRVMTRGNRRLPRISKARLEEMIEQATVDAYDESEQITGWFTMIDENLASAVRDHGAWNSGYRRTPRPEPERANCRCLQAGARSPVAPHSRSAATHAAAGRRGVDRSISSVACRRMTDMGACWPISRLAQAPSAPAAAAASSARVPRRQNAGRQGGLTYWTVEELVRGILRSLGELQPAVSDPASVRIDRRYLFWIASDTMSAR